MLMEHVQESNMAKQIMVVDDDAGALVLVDIMLRRGGFIVLKAHGALAALDMLEETTPDLFILDLMMPGMNGIELCRQIRARLQTSRTPVIILSAHCEAQNVEKGFEAGANDYLSKPILHHDLVTKVRSMLDLGEGGTQLA